MKKKCIIVFIALMIIMTINIKAINATNNVNKNQENLSIIGEKEPQISYTTHVQNIGWQNYVKDGEMSGTSGKALRLEGIKIQLLNQDVSGDIEYSTHVQNIGWQNYVKNNEMSGTSGKALRLEAIRIRLTGEMSKKYDVYYRVHAQNFGWLGWAKNGQDAGTQGYAYRLEGIEIKLVKKGETISNNVKAPFEKAPAQVKYTTHVQNIGWQTYERNGQMSGTSGKALRLEGIKIQLFNQDVSGNIEYATHVQNIGWQNYVKNGEMSGTSGKALRLEAIRIRLTGEMANKYDVYYRVHAQNFGWLGWTKNGENAGTQGYAYRLEGVEIKLIKKGEAGPGKTVVEAFKIKTSETIEPEETEKPKETEKPIETVKAIQGIDVSSWQGVINWKAVKSSGVQFAMIRAGIRGYGKSSDGIDGKLVKDERFDINMRNAISANIPIGVYFYSQAKTEKEAIEEAELVLSMIKDYKITYPVAIDTEYSSSPTRTGRADALTKQERTKIVKAFCEKIKSAGYIPMIYTNKNFAIENLDVSALSTYDFWIAHYTGATQDSPEKNKTDYAGKYTIWQFTESGTVDGIETNVDMNLCYKTY